MVRNIPANRETETDVGIDEPTSAPMDGVIRFLERAATMKAKKGPRMVDKDEDPGPEAA